ncbi:16417_t:CDS:2 [Entrophospora sp. SA101]|nr:16417_t:CDS:2 [Entrophospora sp. SA101]
MNVIETQEVDWAITSGEFERLVDHQQNIDKNTIYECGGVY